jgi:uncharacterized protein YecT (DUF1311 family)
MKALILAAAVLFSAGTPLAAGDLIDRARVMACYQEHIEAREALNCIGAAAAACQEIHTDQFEGSTTVGIAACLSAETEVWDALLNTNYRLRRAEMAAQDADQGTPLMARVEALRQAQRAWIAFRDAECRRLYAEHQGGTLRTIIGASCHLTLTARRAVDLYLASPE